MYKSATCCNFAMFEQLCCHVEHRNSCLAVCASPAADCERRKRFTHSRARQQERTRQCGGRRQGKSRCAWPQCCDIGLGATSLCSRAERAQRKYPTLCKFFGRAWNTSRLPSPFSSVAPLPEAPTRRASLCNGGAELLCATCACALEFAPACSGAALRCCGTAWLCAAVPCGDAADLLCATCTCALELAPACGGAALRCTAIICSNAASLLCAICACALELAPASGSARARCSGTARLSA